MKARGDPPPLLAVQLVYAALQAVGEDPCILEVRGQPATLPLQLRCSPPGLLQLGLQRGHLHTHTHTHTHTYIHTHTHTHMYRQTDIHTLIYKHRQTDRRMHAHTHAHMHIYADMHIYTDRYTQSYKNTNTNIQTQQSALRTTMLLKDAG